MESNLTKILIKKILGKVCIPPPGYLTKRYDPPLFWQSLSPSPVRPQAPSPPPLKKTSLPLDPINAVKKLKILNFNIKQAKFYF